MTAGSIAVPTVMPLRLPSAGTMKNSIDSNTLIEIHSETPNTRVYYTVDNTRPDPDKKLGENTTLLYKQPFMLRHGKRHIKALARSRDGRESNVVTKVFNVEYAEPASSSGSECETVSNVDSYRHQSRKSSMNESRNASPYLEERRGSKEAWKDVTLQPSVQGHFDLRINTDSLLRPRSAMTQRGSLSARDVVRCVYCDAPRARNSSSKFCSDCGKPVPVDPNMSTGDQGTMGMCTKCRSYIPLLQSQCIVCEEPLTGSRPRPTTSIRMQDSILCGACGTNNPSSLTHCASCEHRFPTPVHSGTNAPPLPRLDGELVRCPSCSRVNNPDARYCDWCGEKPIPEQSPLTCSLCKHNNPPYSKFCGQCGSTFVAPDRMDPRNVDLGRQASSFQFKELPMWQTVPLPTLPKSPQSTRVVRAAKPRTSHMETQTVGMFYPGGKKVHQEQELMQEMRNQELKMRDKIPPLTAVSPGRGYWRKQLDHICGHLRGYTNNNVEFRSVIADPKLGKILSTSVDEREEELTVSMTFALKGHTEYGDGGARGLQRDLYLSKKKKIAFGSVFDQEGDEVGKSGKKKKGKKKSAVREERIHPEDRLLAKELGPRGEGRSSEVKQLLKEGADPNCLNPEHRTVLSVAVMNNNLDCVRELIKGGADVDRRSGPHHNAPLHQAVKLGPDGKDMVKLLLRYGARPDVKNEQGLSPYDQASRAGYNAILSLFDEPKETKKARPRKTLVEKKKSSEDSGSSTDSKSDSEEF